MSTLLRRAVLASVLTVGGLAFTSESRAQGFGIGYGNYGPYGSGFNVSIGSGPSFIPGFGVYRPVVRPVPVPVIVPPFGYRPPFYGGFPHGGGYGGGYGGHCHRPYPRFPY